MNLNLTKQFKIFLQALRMQWITVAEYKINFLADFVIQLIGFFVFIATWQSILGSGSLPGWDLKGLLVLYSIENLFLAFIFAFVFGSQAIRQAVTNGSLDIYLSRPTIPWFVLVVINNFFSMGGILVGIGGLLIAFLTFNLNISPLALLLVFLFLIVSTLIALMFSLTMNTLAFWLGKFNLASTIFWSFFEFDFYPINIFPVFIQLIVAFTIPFLFSNTIPALIILEKITVSQALFYLLAAIGIFIVNFSIFLWLWKRGVQKYESFGG